MKPKKCQDHLGNTFNSIIEMCNYYNISKATYKNRKRLGWSIEDILTKPVKNVKESCKDHLNNEYESIEQMCKRYKISRETFESRLSSGWNLEKALKTPVNKRNIKYKDHKGQEFKDIKEMCKHWKIEITTFSSRVNRGWTVQEALETPIGTKLKRGKECVDHLGNKFNSIQKMCEYWNITPSAYKARKLANWNEKEIFETPMRTSEFYIDKYGNKFFTKGDLYKHYK